MKPPIKELLHKYNQGTASPEEQELLEQWYLSLGTDHPAPDQDSILRNFQASKQIIQAQYPKERRLFLRVASVAAALTLAFTGYYLWNKGEQVESVEQSAGIQISPGQELALYKATNGEDVNLSDIQKGKSISADGLTFIKTDEGKIELKYEEAVTASQAPKMHQIQTPLGAEFEVTMPDGSAVKLNAASSLTFKSDYNQKNREVELQGEGFFDVQKASKPFVVHSKNQIVSVLGTQFNIKAYPNEALTTTKLIRGSVKIKNTLSNKELTMKPGDEVSNTGNSLALQENAHKKVDWVAKEIIFDSEEIGFIMNDIARWYNVEVVFENPAQKTITYSGTISRYADFHKVLEVLEKTGSLTFDVEGRKITVK